MDRKSTHPVKAASVCDVKVYRLHLSILFCLRLDLVILSFTEGIMKGFPVLADANVVPHFLHLLIMFECFRNPSVSLS